MQYQHFRYRVAHVHPLSSIKKDQTHRFITNIFIPWPLPLHSPRPLSLATLCSGPGSHISLNKYIFLLVTRHLSSEEPTSHYNIYLLSELRPSPSVLMLTIQLILHYLPNIIFDFWPFQICSASHISLIKTEPALSSYNDTSLLIFIMPHPLTHKLTLPIGQGWPNYPGGRHASGRRH
jgi:hypothetical protein